MRSFITTSSVAICQRTSKPFDCMLPNMPESVCPIASLPSTGATGMLW